MKVSDLFTVQYGHSLELNALIKSNHSNAINFVSRTAKNNGVSARVEPLDGVEPSSSGTLSVALGGSVLETFLQPSPYYTGYHVAVLTPLAAMEEVELLWWASCIRANKYRYNYGRQANRTLSDLELPDAVPTWVVPEIMPSLVPPPASLANSPVDTSDWQAFRWTDVFTIHRGIDIPSKEQKPGATPFVTSTALNNGISRRLSVTATHPAGVLTVARNGSVGQAFYQPQAFYASGDVHVLHPLGFELTPARGLFLSTLIRLEIYRFNYGRKWSVERMEDSVIRLPITAQGIINWGWVDSYMNTLPYIDMVS